MPITTGSIKGEESSTTTFKVRTVTINQNSSNMQQEILTIGDPQTSNALARVTAAAPVSTEFGLLVRVVSGPSSAADNPVQISGNSTVLQGTNPWTIAGNSTVSPLAGSTWATRPIQSSAADLQMTATQGTNPWVISGNSTVVQGTSPWVVSATRINIGSTAADNAVTVSGNSTVAPLAGSTWNTRPIQSSAADLQVTATIGTNLQSTVAGSSNSSALLVRPIIDNILTTASSNAFGTSTTLSLQSSGAGLRSYVVGYSITSTVQAVTKIAFMSGSTLLWPVAMAALSSAFSGVNLAVSAPAYLFRTKTAGPLSLNTGNSSIVGFKVGVSYFRAP
jgi:hypothetical protein